MHLPSHRTHFIARPLSSTSDKTYTMDRFINLLLPAEHKFTIKLVVPWDLKINIKGGTTTPPPFLLGMGYQPMMNWAPGNEAEDNTYQFLADLIEASAQYNAFSFK